MNIQNQSITIRRKCFSLHAESYLNGRSPMYLKQVTTCTTKEGTKSLRREYVIVTKPGQASHVSFRGKRDVVLELIDVYGKAFYGNAMELNEPITIHQFACLNDELVKDPDATPEMLANSVIQNNHFKQTGNHKWNITKLYHKFSNWISSNLGLTNAAS